MVPIERKTTFVKDYMSNRLVTVESDTNAFEIANKMMEEQVSAIIVVDSGKFVGILTERDLTRQVCAKDSPPSKTPATAIMTTPLVSVDKDSRIEMAAESMAKNKIRHLVVKDNDKIIGMITTTDLSRYVKDKLSGEEGVSHSILEALYPSEEPSEESWW